MREEVESKKGERGCFLRRVKTRKGRREEEVESKEEERGGFLRRRKTREGRREEVASKEEGRGGFLVRLKTPEGECGSGGEMVYWGADFEEFGRFSTNFQAFDEPQRGGERSSSIFNERSSVLWANETQRRGGERSSLIFNEFSSVWGETSPRLEEERGRFSR